MWTRRKTRDTADCQEVYVIPVQRTSNVVSANTGMDTILLGDDYIIDVEPGATIIKKTGASYVPIDLNNLKPGDEVTVFGLDNCKLTKHFYGYIVVGED